MMMAIERVDVPATEVVMCWLDAVLASEAEPRPKKVKPLREASNVMSVRP